MLVVAGGGARSWRSRITGVVHSSFAITSALVVAPGRHAVGQVRHVERFVMTADQGLPLQPDRLVHFPATEGTWISLDISPDGHTIVFDLLGDLYTIPIGGGKATRLTSGMALNRQPRYSPDGRHLVFVSDRNGRENIWISETNGRNAHQLSDLHFASSIGAVTSPEWSPDGSTIVVSQRLGATQASRYEQGWAWSLARYDVKTRRMRWVTDTAPDRAHLVLGPAFGSDGRTVFASVDAHRKNVWEELAGWRVAAIDLGSGRIEPMAGVSPSVGARAGLRPALSPDGRHLVYATNSGSRIGFRIRDLRTDRERWLVRDLVDDPPNEFSEPRDLVPGYAFTPDAKTLVAAYGGKIHRIDVSSGRTSLIPFIVDVRRELGPLTVYQHAISDNAVRTRSILQPALSPDGDRVAFTALDRIWLLELPRNGHRVAEPYRATADSGLGEFYPSWSPDGRWIAYSTWVDGNGGAVRRVRAATDRQAPPLRSERLTWDRAAYFQTAVSSDSRRVMAVRASASPERVFTRRLEAEDFQLVQVPVAGGHESPITITMASEFSALYRYPVDQLYLTSGGARIHVGLKSWALDGRPSGQLTVVTPERTGGGLVDPDVAGVLSPDRCRAFIAWNSALFELRLASCSTTETDTFHLMQAQTRRLSELGENRAHRWGAAIAPWISWSRDGRRVVFSQGGALFVGTVAAGAWTVFEPLEVPLMVATDIPRTTTAFRGARLITMRGRQVIERGDLVVRNNRILAVGSHGSVAIPKGAHIVDVTGCTILPGYVDLHDHQWRPEGVHLQQRWGDLVRLAHGVTTYREPTSGWGGDVFTYQERQRTGSLLGPRIFSTGMAFYGADRPLRDLEGARERVRVNVNHFGVETFKVYYGAATGRRVRQLLTMATREQHLNATAHTNGIELQLASTIDGLSGIEHAPGIAVYDDVTTFIARSGTTQTHTYVLLPGALNYMFRHYGGAEAWSKMRRFIPPGAEGIVCYRCTGEKVSAYGPIELDKLLPLLGGAGRIAFKGGRVGIGAHGEAPGIGYHYELWLHAMGGMANHEVLKAATLAGATAIGHARDLGSLEPGKLADLQILDTNPIDDIHNSTAIRYVMMNGRLYRAKDLTEVWPRYRPLPPVYLWDQSRKTASERTSRSNQ